MRKPDVRALEFWSTPAPMTELPFDTCAEQLAGLPADPMAAASVARGVLVHRDWAPGLGLHFSPERLADQHLRPARVVVERVLEIDARPLAEERALPDRMVGVCRHFTTLHVAMLRAAGVPARARVGFARYFGDGWVDHWITEWWDGSAWTRTDAQVGPVARDFLGVQFDPNALPPGEFPAAPEAWQACRAGTHDPNQFGIFDLRGLGFIVGDLIQDLAALNKVELLPWDIWGTLHDGPDWQPDDEGLARVDALAALVCDGDLEALRSRFRDDDVRVPPVVTSYIDGQPTPTAIDTRLLTPTR